MAIKNLVDFRGGYSNSVPPELMDENELSKAENCTWKNGLVKRNGTILYDATDFSSMVGMKGSIRAYINDTWYTIIAVDDDSNCRIYAGTTTTFTEIDASFTLTKGVDFEFAELLGHVVGVNGTDKPFVIYWDSALAIENLEAYDTRERESVNWFAGQWHESIDVGYQECGLSGIALTDDSGLPVSSCGYQECGLSDKTTSTETGLSTSTQYYFKVNVDGGGLTEYSLTTGAFTTYGTIMAMMNLLITGAEFTIEGGDLRCTSNTLGTGSSIALGAGTTGTDLFGALTDFTSFDSAVAGATATYYYKINIDGGGVTEYSITVDDSATFAEIIILMNANHSGASFSVTGGDLRCTSATVGSESAIALSAGTTGTDMFSLITDFVDFDTATTEEYGSHFIDDTTDAQSEGGTEMMTYGNCENANSPTLDGTPMAASGGMWVRHSTIFSSGASSWKLQKTVASGTAAYQVLADNNASNDMHGFEAGGTYRIRLSLRTTTATATSGLMRLFEYHDGDWYSTTVAQSTQRYVWQDFETEITINSGSTAVYLMHYILSTEDNTNRFLYLDNISVQRIDDYQICGIINGNGLYIACDYTFNKIIFRNAQLASGTPVDAIEYYAGDGTWTSVGTPVTDVTWTDALGDKTLEFNLPLDSDGVLAWEPYDQDDEEDTVVNKYVIRIRFTTAPDAAFGCEYLSLYNTQYLTQILQDERPHLVRMHNSQIYMASNNIVNFSPPYYVTGWREGQAEHFDEGGAKIIDMASFSNMLMVGKERTLYSWDTSDLNDPVRSRPLTTVGPICSRSMKQIGDVMTFVARDGIYMWNGETVSKVSKHIQEDIDSYTLTNAVATVWKNEYWIAFPTNSVVLVFDPDTYRTDDMGDGKVSFYKFTNYKVSQFMPCVGAGDTGFLLAIVDQASPYVFRCDSGTQDNITAATNIDMRIQTKYYSFGSFQTPHSFGRLKVKVKKVSAFSGKKHMAILYRDDGEEYVKVPFDVPKGSGYHTEEIRVPYNVDGKSFSFELRHRMPTLATLIGFAVEVEERSY